MLPSKPVLVVEEEGFPDKEVFFSAASAE